MPTASEITVHEVLDKFDGEFSRVATAIANGEFALWIGSGISRKAPSLGGLVDLAIEHLRVCALHPDTAAAYMPAFREALEISELDVATLEEDFEKPFSEWTQHQAIKEKVWGKYSRLLDVRIEGKTSDFILWEAIDIRAAFANPPRPAAEHLCIAVLVMEGAIKEMASGNWDGFIEAAVDRLAGGGGGVLQAVVDPNHLRTAAGAARLLKFHGCIVHAAAEPGVFRDYLTGSHTQVLEWADKPLFAAMRAAVNALAANHKSMVMGLSIQDMNLQGVFSEAKQTNSWPWPPDPNAQGHVFCQDALTIGQKDVLKLVYGEAYNTSTNAILGSAHLRAWPEQVLIALVLHVLQKKLTLLLESTLASKAKSAWSGDMCDLLTNIRNTVADLATWDALDQSRTEFVYAAISIWSRVLAVFRTGALPKSADEYQAVSSSGLRQLATDDNALAAGLGIFAMALSMLQHGRETALWSISAPVGAGIEHGAFTATGTWDGAPARPVFLVKGIGEALALQQAGAFANDNAIVLHADTTWSQVMTSNASARRVGSSPGRSGRSSTHHISIESLIDRCNTADLLKSEFITEASI